MCESCDHGDVWTCLGLVVRDERGILLIFVDNLYKVLPGLLERDWTDLTLTYQVPRKFTLNISRKIS